MPVALVLGIVLVIFAAAIPLGRRSTASPRSCSSAPARSTTASPERRTRVCQAAGPLEHLLIIAGSYTPFAVVLLPPEQERTLLILVWSGALAGVLFRVFWVGAPRWLYTPIYIALGWVAVFYLPAFWEAGGPLVVILLALGGIFYSVGGVVYALKRPNPSPTWFGFHEVFHADARGLPHQYVAVSSSSTAPADLTPLRDRPRARPLDRVEGGVDEGLAIANGIAYGGGERPSARSTRSARHGRPTSASSHRPDGTSTDHPRRTPWCFAVLSRP